MKTRTPSARRFTGPILLLSAATLPLQAQLTSHNFGSFTMDFVTIGNPGNVADITGLPNPAGSVASTFQMGKYEVSRDMITKANAAVASGGGNLGITLANMSSYGGNGVNRPATGVTWNEAARFVNWLNTSQGYSPAYKFSLQPGDGGYSANANIQLWAPGDLGYNPNNLFRNANAVYFLPSENEWYKAAFFSPGGVYYNYPTGSDGAPTAVASGTTAGTAVYNQPLAQGPADIANAGGLSPYGTMGQGGNVWEWMESAYTPPNDSGSENRAQRGGTWYSPAGFLGSSGRSSDVPTFENGFIGFRVAAVPEPWESAGVIGLAALGFALWRRRGSL